MVYARKQYKKPFKRYVKKKTMARKPTYTRPYKARIYKSLNPFPKVKNVTLIYKNTSNNVSSSTGIVLQRLRCNSLFDADYDNIVGNKGPLYKDQLMGANGPYLYYKVNAWSTTIRVINVTTNLQGQSDCPLYVFFDPGAIGSFAEADTDAEIQNRPGVIRKMLTAPLGSVPMTTIKSYKTVKSFAPQTSNGLEYASAWNNNPTNTIFSTIYVRRIDNSVTTFSVAFEVTHKFYATLYSHDASVSA